MSIKVLNQKGIGLIEVIAALGIAVIVITSLVSLSVYTLRSSLQSNLQLEGTKIASRELELVRALRDSTTWSSFLGTTTSCFTNPCSMDTVNYLTIIHSDTVENAGTPKQLTRSFTLSYPNGIGDPSVVRVSVLIKWQIGGKDKYERVYTDLTNWRGN